MSSNYTCGMCGFSYSVDNSTHLANLNLCHPCYLATIPSDPADFTPTTPVADVERVQGIYLPATDPRSVLFTVNVNVYYEQGRTYRVPQLDFLGPRNTLFYISIKRGLGGQRLSSPYRVYFQTNHGNVPNQCVWALTQGSPQQEWFGDIVALKFDGQRMERFSHATIADDMVNITGFFLNSTVAN
ncbi:hypothetical protein OPQ81_005324 [Rhizoctonia solani]|nr:hypothetical protein OPQ81_005324 [Rhizoctonia solani]